MSVTRNERADSYTTTFKALLVAWSFPIKLQESSLYIHFESHEKAFVFPSHLSQFSSSELSSQSTIPSHLKEIYIYSRTNYFSHTDMNQLVEHISFLVDNKHVYLHNIFLYYNLFHLNHQDNLKHHLI
jgi:hypothetical protein